MSELKTLKDIQDKNPCMKCGSIQCATCYDDLEKEIIKWIKKLKTENAYCLIHQTDLTIDHINCILGLNGHDYALDDVINFIKYFFNITDEDLK